ncbi:peptidylprolyl isomerase/peptidyl-prolyl cis-trans isomerase B (cyclophilin B)/FKBP-type peptidyl-prolyl cis-trans isomerase SlyD [Halobiforma haloterrestris]|uniref:Peptidyl-prolyl cis-trans isomerase n=1 Tax=Natronobacterium haloterrestre TaxID=148448 RepID=A0A1I1I0S0_NATHA|nr:FKBP-type peptidyl-prolyl cis-trans isomerase [Halobiforma haloterrestris]SFC29794.1 peptidylprolyl isomerase/peptidyl-prolyl cis-trans isomerase B (cyclophilin B)/FKBP-type peptidyl-prolyl cis-trans isomerase SlyD [Halobiforma haloterrestris]
MVEPGRIAVVHFTGRIAEGDDEGEVFDTTNVDVALEEGIYHDHRDYKPLEFRVGEGKVLEGIDRVVQDLSVGDRTTVELEPEEAFGPRREDEILEVPLDHLERDEGANGEGDGDGDETIEPGTLVGSETGDTGWVVSVDGETATVDFNHELAGTRIECEIHVLDARGSPGEGTA